MVAVMSIEHVAAVLRSAPVITPTQKLVLIGLANHDGDGGAWPSVATLARYAGCTERSVQRAIKALEQVGLVTRHAQQGGTDRTDPSRRPNRYTVHYDRLSTGVTPTSPGDASVTPPPDTHVTPGVTPTSPRGVTPTSPEPSIEPSTEPSAEGGSVASATRLCHLMADLIQTYDGYDAPRPGVGKRWVDQMDRMIRLDGRDPERIESVLRWLYQSTDRQAVFWAPNVRSPGKLREKWATIAGQVHADRQLRAKRAPGINAILERRRQRGEGVA